jgi:hypothetical protein
LLPDGIRRTLDFLLHHFVPVLLVEMNIPRTLADHTMVTLIHDGAQVFRIVMGLSTREVTCCTTLLAIGGELSRPANVHRLWNKKFDLKLKILVGFYLVFIIRQDLFDLHGTRQYASVLFG